MGGGIANFTPGTVILSAATISNNSVYNGLEAVGGGIYTTGSINLTNTTISGNRVGFANGTTVPAKPGRGGGIFTQGGAVLKNVTIAGNSTSNRSDSSGGGIYGGASLSNTIISDNTSFSTSPNISGTVSSLGNNLISNTTGSSGWVNSDIVNQNARLAPLGNYGGATQTHSLLPDSPAIDKGSNALAVDPVNGIALAFDQRGTGFPRFVDGDGNGSAIVDIGSFERQANANATAIISGRITNAQGQNIGTTVLLTLTGGNLTEPLFARATPAGYYRFEAPAGHTYTVTPVPDDRTFTPENRQVTLSLENIFGVDFITQ
jgi:hypothetical protein